MNENTATTIVNFPGMATSVPQPVTKKTMPLYSGLRMDFNNITSDSINIIDIVEALAKINRYQGHTLFPYSVAQHSCYVVDLVSKEFEDDPAAILYAALHDAHEAFKGDTPTPLKEYLKAAGAWQVVQDLEDKLDEVIHAKFGLQYPVPEPYASAVARADLVMVATERDDVMPPIDPDQWWNIAGVERADFVIASMDWQEAKESLSVIITKAWNELRRKNKKPTAVN